MDTAPRDTSTMPVPDIAVPAVVNLSDAIVLKEGGAFLMSLRDGSMPVHGTHPLGVYLDDCRYVSGHELLVGGVAPRLLVASTPAGSEGVHELTNPDMHLPDGKALALQTLQVRLERRLVAPGRLLERIHVHLYGHEPVDIDVELALAADFRPMFAIRGIVDLPPVEVSIERGPRRLRFHTVTRDGVERSTVVEADRAPAAAREGVLCFPLRLQPGDHEDIRLDYELRAPDEARPRRGGVPLAGSGPVARTRVHADDELFNRVVQRSLLDLQTLRTPLDGDYYYAAGVPWFATLFGRDSVITALEMLGFAPEMGEHTLRLLAKRLGQREDPIHEEEPGKVIHELRVGEVATLALSPLTRYYGTVDATPLFLCLLAEHANWTGDLGLFRELRGAVVSALGWLEHYGDHDGDGLLDYRASTPEGLRNQGWKDSDDGVLDETGTPLEPPIALVEAQAYAVRALRGVARLFALDGDPDRAQLLISHADELEARLERFWVPGRGFYGMGIDGLGRTSGALASNQGHLLWARAIPPARARAVRDALMSEAMFSGWGIRTLGRGEGGFNPVGYHLGTVWPHDTAIIAAGLRRYGFDEEFNQLFEALLEAASHAEGYRLPELFAGFSRAQYETPVPYPVACHPQAWAAGAIPYMLMSGLGLEADALEGRLRVRRPSLPRWVNRVEVKDLYVGGSRVGLLFERTGSGDQVALTDARIEGDLEVVLEISASRD
ncbi:MAG: putative Amylo-alpha,6-glucosidase [Solirubrobacterales bacterium]|nr:putative Amylo-alpha,6-glucosidase [Solirubrobacterales bacterium]